MNTIQHSDISNIATPFAGQLQSWGVLRFNGDSVPQFFQGQFSCDANSVSEQHTEFGCCCNPKGRIIANFFVAQWGQYYYLILPRDSIDPLMTHLKKYMVFYKIEMQDISEEMHIHAISSSLCLVDQELSYKQSEAQAHYFVFAHDPLSNHCLVLSSLAELPLKQATHTLSDHDWCLYLIQKAMPFITASNTGEHLPHYLNMTQLQGVNFKKGCYTGQEIIARMHYRGTIKRHTYPISIYSPSPISIQMPIVDTTTNKTVGYIVNCTKVNNTEYKALAELEDDCLQATLKVNDAQSNSEIKVLPLPFEIEET